MRLDGSAFFVFKSQSEIPHQPQKARKAVYNIIHVLRISLREQLTQVHNQTQTLNGLLINIAHTIVNKVTRQQHSHQEYLRIGILTLLQRPQPLRIHNQRPYRILPVRDLHWLGPYPQPLRAGIDGGPYLKPTVLLQEHPVQDVAFAGAVFADDGDHGEVAALTVQGSEQVDGLFVDFEHWVRREKYFGRSRRRLVAVVLGVCRRTLWVAVKVL